MNVGILGLGLIGGSLARAYALEGHTVYAIQRNEAMLSFAMLAGAVHGKLTEETIPECDLILQIFIYVSKNLRKPVILRFPFSADV